MDEVMELFPSQLIHIGGDECPKYSWKRCPHCQALIKKLGLKDEEVSKKIDETVKSINNSQVSADTVKSYYGEYYFEYMTVSEKVADFLYKNAKIS